MSLRELYKATGLQKIYHNLIFCKMRRRLRLFSRTKDWSVRYLFPGRVYLDMVDIVITTKCSLLCKNCSHLIPYYNNQEHVDKDRIIASMRKLDEAVDQYNQYSILGGEPLLDPNLKYYLEAIPTEKCNWTCVSTNGTVIPDDPELFEVLRRKKILVLFTEYPSNHEIVRQFVDILERENVAWRVKKPVWFNFGTPVDYQRSSKALKHQFIHCETRAVSVLNGKLYYCPRSAHTYNLKIVDEGAEVVDLLKNTASQNRRKIRRLIWWRRPIGACNYCLRGTDEAVKIPRG